jgi:glycosyltransferase involved in cell wall biosynthesis
MVSRYEDQVTVFTTTARNMNHFWRSRDPGLPAGTENIHGVTVRRFPVFNRFGWLRKLLAHGAHRLRIPYNDWLRTIYNGPLIWDMTRAIANSGADIVLASAFPLLHMYYALAGAQRAGIPIVFLGAIHVADTWGYDREIIYRAIRRADAYIALTTFERDHLARRGVAREKIAVVGAGVDAEPFLDADGTVLRAKYGWQDAPVVAMLAKHGIHKRFDTLLAAMRNVWQARPETRLLLAGARTPYSEQIERTISTLSPEQQAHVTMIDDFAEQAKPQILAACDLFVLPSGYESFGIAFVEAWACGKPVIGARIGAVQAVIDDGRDGLLVAYQDADDLARAILELLSDPQRRAAMGKAGRQKVLENYTWEIVADRVRAVYTKIAQEPTPSARYL